MKSAETSQSATAEVLVLDLMRMEVGDIVLTKSAKQLARAVSDLVSGDEFTHALLVTDAGLAVEAQLEGLHRTSLRWIHVEKSGDMRVLRLREPEWSKGYAKDAAGVAEWLVSSDYWMKGVVARLRNAVSKQSAGRYFCSHLVAEAYRKARVALLPEIGPERVLPSDLLKSPYLVDVTETVTRRVRSAPFYESLPQPDERYHLREMDLVRAVCRDHNVILACDRLGIGPYTNFHLLLDDLEKKGDRALDDAIYIALGKAKFAEMTRATLLQFRQGLTNSHERTWAQLQIGGMTEGECVEELRVLLENELVFQKDIEHRRRDVEEDWRKYQATGYRTFYQRWNLAQEFLEMSQKVLAITEEEITWIRDYMTKTSSAQ